MFAKKGDGRRSLSWGGSDGTKREQLTTLKTTGRLVAENKLVAHRDLVLTYERDIGLQVSRPGDRAAVQLGQCEALPLVRTQRPEVVVRGDKPDRHRGKARLEGVYQRTSGPRELGTY